MFLIKKYDPALKVEVYLVRPGLWTANREASLHFAGAMAADNYALASGILGYSLEVVK